MSIDHFVTAGGKVLAQNSPSQHGIIQPKILIVPRQNNLGNNTVSAALSSLLGSGVFSPMPGEIFMISSLLQSSYFDRDLLS